MFYEHDFKHHILLHFISLKIFLKEVFRFHFFSPCVRLDVEDGER